MNEQFTLRMGAFTYGIFDEGLGKIVYEFTHKKGNYKKCLNAIVKLNKGEMKLVELN